MIYILSGLTGLLILVALFTLFINAAIVKTRRPLSLLRQIAAELMRYVKKD